MTKFTRSLLLAGAVLVASTVFSYEVFQGPTELIHHDPARAFAGYTMFGPISGEAVYLVDMQGRVVHSWPTPADWGQGPEARHARLLPDGTLQRGAGGVFQIVDWDGAVVWEYREERPGVTAHHEFRNIWNPKLGARTLLYAASSERTHEEVVALGADPSVRDDYASRPEGLVEVDMGGNIIWEWNVSDHTVNGKAWQEVDWPAKLDGFDQRYPDARLLEVQTIDYLSAEGIDGRLLILQRAG